MQQWAAHVHKLLRHSGMHSCCLQPASRPGLPAKLVTTPLPVASSHNKTGCGHVWVFGGPLAAHSSPPWPYNPPLAAPQQRPGCARLLAARSSPRNQNITRSQRRSRSRAAPGHSQLVTAPLPGASSHIKQGCGNMWRYLSVCDWAPYSGLTWVRISCCRNALNTGCEVRGTSPSRRRRAARRSRAAAEQHHACERPNAREMSRGLRDVRSAIHVRLGVHAGMSTGMQDERLYSFQYSECDGCFRDEHDRRKDISRRSRCRATYLHEGIGAAIKWHARPRVIHHTVRIHCEPYPCLL